MRYLPARELLSYEEIEMVVSAMAEAGVRRVRVTGGEPLVRRELPSLISRLKGIDGIDEVVMTTNAHRLEQSAQALRDAGLDGLNISIDSLRTDRFARITRGGDLARVLRGLDAAKAAGIPSIKVNTVVIGGFNEDEILDVAHFSVAHDVVLRYIEFMPIGADTVWGEGRCVPAKEIRRQLATAFDIAPEGARPGKGPARYMRMTGAQLPPEGHLIGIISAVTECFCDSCNRVRLTALGGLRACLADDGEVNLRDVIRSGGGRAEVVAAVRRALGAKKETHAFDLEGGSVTLKQMVSIGG